MWSYDTARDGPPAQFHGDPLVTGQALVIGTDTDSIGHLYAFERATGAVRWKHAFAGGFPSQILVHGKTVFGATGATDVVAVDVETGAVRWRAHGPADVEPAFNTSDPVIGNGRLVVAWRAGWVDAFDVETGRVLWRTSLLSLVNTSIYLQADTVAVGTTDGLMHRLRLADGAELGRVEVGGMPLGDIVAAAGTVLVLTKSDEIYRLTGWDRAFAKKVWVYQAPRPWTTFRPAVQGNAVRVGYQSRLIELDLRTGAEINGCDIDGSPRGLAWDDTGSYVGLFEGAILRLQTAE